MWLQKLQRLENVFPCLSVSSLEWTAVWSCSVPPAKTPKKNRYRPIYCLYTHPDQAWRIMRGKEVNHIAHLNLHLRKFELLIASLNSLVWYYLHYYVRTSRWKHAMAARRQLRTITLNACLLLKSCIELGLIRSVDRREFPSRKCGLIFTPNVTKPKDQTLFFTSVNITI